MSDDLWRAAEAVPIVPAPPWAPLPVRDVAPRDRRAAIATLLAWARAGGARWDAIDFVVDARGDVSARTTRPLAPGAHVLTLPRSLMIVDDGSAAPRDALARWLPRARSPYIDALPAHVPLPFYAAVEPVGAVRAHVADDIAATYARLAPDVTLAEFAWGCAIAISRGFHAPGTFEHRVALMPLVDLLDHAVGDTAWTYDGALHVTAARGFAAGEPIGFSYGDRRSNAYLRAHYGFALPDDPHAEAALVFARPADPITEAAAHLLWGLPVGAPARVCVCRDNVARAISVARLHATTAGERDRLELWDGEVERLDDDHERRARAILADAIARADGPADERALLATLTF